jgi:hypothetical protein
MAVISNAVTIADAGAFSASLGSMVLIKTITLSSAAGTIDFVNGASSVVFDGTYPIYKFEFLNLHPATDDVDLTFQVDVGTGTSYAQTITSTAFQAFHGENGANEVVAYKSDRDLAQGTGFQPIAQDSGNGNDESMSGELTIFSPSSSTFIKHFTGLGTSLYSGDASLQIHIAGYVNTTTALTRIRFKFSSGNIDSGTIKLYGIKDS